MMKGKIIKKNILSKKWAEYAEYIVAYTRSDGQEEILTREVHDSGDGVAIILYNLSKQNILLIKQFRLPALLKNINGGVIIESCAGLVENNNPRETVIRETKEEIGLEIGNPQFLFNAFASPGAKSELISFYICEYPDTFVPNKHAGLKVEQEDIEIIEIPFKTAFSWIESGKIIDAKTIILLYHLKSTIFI